MTSKEVEETEFVLDPTHQQESEFQDHYGAAGAENKWNKNGFGQGKKETQRLNWFVGLYLKIPRTGESEITLVCWVVFKDPPVPAS